jgi:RNA-binding protein
MFLYYHRNIYKKLDSSGQYKSRHMLKIAGHFTERIGERRLLLRCEAGQLPKLYSDVMDRRFKKIGKLVEIFGNVDSPYALVICPNKCPPVKAGEKLYIK